MKIRLSLHRKMIIFLIPASLLVFGGAIAYIITKSRQKAIEDTMKIADESAEKYAQIIKSDIDAEFDIARAMSYTFNSFHTLENIQRREIYDKILMDVFQASPQYVSFWLNFELTHVDNSYLNKSGRARYTYYRDNFNKIDYYTDTLDRDVSKINSESAYQKMKVSKLETLIEPYYFSYTGKEDEQVLETSICVPILRNGEFAGLVGSDLLLDYFQDILSKIEIYGGGYAFFLSNKGTIIAFPDEEKIGSNFREEYKNADVKYSVIDNIQLNRRVSYRSTDFYSGKESYLTYIPITMGKSITPWCFAVSVPFDSIIKESKKTMWSSLFISFCGILLLSLIIYIIAKMVTNPLKLTTSVLKRLSEGNINSSDKLQIHSGDEIEDMADSVNQLIDGLGKTAEFARTIGQGNLEAKYEKAGANDVLGNSLLEMRQSLVAAATEEEKRKAEDEKVNWATQGQAKFGDILRQHNQSIDELSFNIMSNLVDYVEAIQGALFVKNDDNEEESIFELTGAIAYDRKKVLESKFKLGEGLIGRCAYEKLTIYMEEVPENYVHVTSGLGESNPRSILLVPAILNEEVYAIIELVSFNKFENHQIEFIERIGESIASTISNARVNDRTTKLLGQSKLQAEELAAQEEEMRQNLEELQTTQEEVGRLREEDQLKNQQLINEIEKHKTAVLKILDYIPVKVFLKDADGRMLIVNKAVLEAHNASRKDLVGKSDFDFIEDKDKAQKLYEEEQEIIKSGNSVNQVYKELINETGIILDSTKYPFFIDYLEETGILGIQIDITALVNSEEQIKQLKKELEKYQ
ncbi:MAG: GAF domain-containing protein [Salinivirgaceae bacterium]|nr:GAF domain-containing protein [Salinivirgaceae bacterium]